MKPDKREQEQIDKLKPLMCGYILSIGWDGWHGSYLTVRDKDNQNWRVNPTITLDGKVAFEVERIN